MPQMSRRGNPDAVDAKRVVNETPGRTVSMEAPVSPGEPFVVHVERRNAEEPEPMPAPSDLDS